VNAQILLVEDHPLNRQLARDILTYRGHAIVEAASVEEAKRKLANAAPDLVLCDIQIPGGGGELVLQTIRANAATSHIPVIAVTAFAMPGDRERLLKAGFDGYIAKPIDTIQFGETVESFLGKRKER
jgi:two-component system, cell cycle response regulator DivK